VGRTLIRQRGPWSDYLDGQLLRIDRTVNVNDEFTAFSRFFVDPSRFAIFKDVAIEALNGQNFRVLLNRQIGSPIEHIAHRLYASRPLPDVSRRLGIEPEQGCSILEIAASLRNRDFIYFQELTVPPSNHRLELADPHSDDYVD
jgi:GntR family transcriptional regulator